MPASEKSAHILSKILIPNNNLDWVFYCDINSKASISSLFFVFSYSLKDILYKIYSFS